MKLEDLRELAQPAESKLLLLVLDGVGGTPMEPGGPTSLEAAATPHMDELARGNMCGLHEPVAAGVAPGSGPGHLALFGYDPLRYRVGRGVLEALGIGYDLAPREVAARGNFCFLDEQGRVADRRAGRISTEAAAPLCDLLDGVEVDGAEVTVRQVKEHRFLLALRFPEPVPVDLPDTDPGRTGTPPLEVEAGSPGSEAVARAVREWLRGAEQLLADRDEADAVLLRGFDRRPDWPLFPDVFGMRALGVAAYPMYRGVARLVGMEAVAVEDGLDPLAGELEERVDDHDFFFLHVKAPDRAGEDGDFDRKVAVIEEADAVVPRLLDVGPDVVLITGDHSTPALLRRHSSHPVPYLLAGEAVRPSGADGFGESACRLRGEGLRRGCELLPLAAAAAGRLRKFGA